MLSAAVTISLSQARELAADANPARLGMITTALGKQVSNVKHMAALPYEEIGAFITDIRVRDGMAARALELTILTAASGHRLTEESD
jgi:hypothetical protein